MKLYEIAEDFRTLFDQLDEFTDNDDLSEEEKSSLEQAWYDTLEGVECDFKEKAENVAAYVKNLKAEADALAEAEKSFAARRRSKEHRIEGLKAYLLSAMDAVHLKNIETVNVKISTRNNAESVAVDDSKAFVEWAQKHGDDFLRYKDPEINKTAVKQALQEGTKLPYVGLQRTRSVIIK